VQLWTWHVSRADDTANLRLTAYPCSEPEAGMLRALAAGWKPHVWVNVHSGMEALFMPYDHRAEVLSVSPLCMEHNFELCGTAIQSGLSRRLHHAPGTVHGVLLR
jgi:hypothetical protein